jgi:hypothetical protein
MVNPCTVGHVHEDDLQGKAGSGGHVSEVVRTVGLRSVYIRGAACHQFVQLQTNVSLAPLSYTMPRPYKPTYPDTITQRQLHYGTTMHGEYYKKLQVLTSSGSSAESRYVAT